MFGPSAAALRAAMPMATSIIKQFESLSLRSYVLFGTWAIGYGKTIQPGQYPTGITEATADVWLQNSVNGLFVQVMAHRPKNATIGQVAAAIDFCYNEGFHAMLDSTWFRLWHNGDASGAALAMQEWDLADGTANEDLLRRRKCEGELMLGASITELVRLHWSP
jgi:GH24 family phage-related lysozyme (muramidase)